MDKNVREREFVELMRELLESDQVRMMGRWRHHGPVTTLDHSLFVAYNAYRMARWFGMDALAAARGGLLHDLYLYDSKDKSAHPGNQCLDHPVFALRNASALTRLSDLERNITLAHMWPLALHMPQSLEAWTVSLADKLCATVEVLQLWRHLKLRTLLAA